MNKAIKHLFSIIFLCLFSFHGIANDNWLPVKRLSSNDGLPTDEVRQIYQDKDGFIWFVTLDDGICRYDGNSIKTYKNNLYTPDLLSSNMVNVLAEDDDGSLWIGTNDGLNVLDKTTGKITHKVQGVLGESVNIQALLVTSTHEVWVGTSKGIMRYIANRDSFIFYNNANTNYSLRGNDIKTLAEDHNGQIWIGTWGEGLTRFDPETEIFFVYPHVNNGNSAHCVFVDNNNTVWVGSWGYGLFRVENAYDVEKVNYVKYRHDDNDSTSLSDNIIYCIAQNSITGELWVGTRSGLSIMDSVESQSFINYSPKNNKGEMVFNEVNSIMQDRDGLMWIGTLGGGVSVVDTHDRAFKSNELKDVLLKVSSNWVRSIYVDDEDKIWMGIGSMGLIKYSPEDNTYQFFDKNSDFGSKPISGTVLYVMQPDNSDEYWIATYGQGIFVYNPTLPQEEKVRNFKTKYDTWLTSNLVNYIKEDNAGRLWIATDKGISVYNPKNNSGSPYPYFGSINDVSKRFSVNYIEQTNDYTMWLSTENGVVKVTKNPQTSDVIKFVYYNRENNKINYNKIQCLYKDTRGRLWLGSKGGGLSLYNEKEDRFVSVQRTYSIPGDIVYNIIEDNNGSLWLGTNSGLVNLSFHKDADGNRKVLAKQYTAIHGLQSNMFNTNAIYKSSGGDIYVGGHNGYNYFNPGKLLKKESEVSVVITDMKIFNTSFNELDDELRSKISSTTPEYVRSIKLPYRYNNISIEFAILNYFNSIQNKYAYKLDGVDNEWQYANGSRGFAKYNNLSIGNHTFYLKGTLGDGKWTEYDHPILIKVLPPFWLRWWAIAIYIIIVLIVLYFVMMMVKGQMLLRNEIRVKDIEQQKIGELNHAKLQFYTNMTHEFLSPLTILSASLDELQTVAPSNKDLYAVMKNNVNRLIRLFQQILEFRKVESGNLKLKVSKGDIAKFMNVAVDSFRPLMRKNKVHFSIICDPNSIVAYFDPDKLDKILYNLLSNASKYNKEGAFVQVNLSYANDKKNHVLLSVKDNGDGIDEKDVKGLFRRFYEGSYRQFNTTGTGIGLSLVKDLVELHKGKISVESDVGTGTCFYIELPITSDAYSESEMDNYKYISESVLMDEIEKEKTTKIGKRKEHTLLIIEDNEELLKLMEKLLKRYYNVFLARNGREGIEMLEKEEIDLAISDVMMPEIDGIEFCKYVKNNIEVSHVPIILLTAKNKEEDRIHGYDSGADGYLTKPFSLNVLHSKIKNLLNNKATKAKDFSKQFVFDLKDIEFTSLDEDFLQRAIDCVNDHLDDPNFDQQAFAEEVGISKSSLYKKLKSLIGMNTSGFIRNIRLKAACKIIQEKKDLRISELAYAVGFNDPKYFSTCFKKEFGLIPSEYLEKFVKKEK